MSRAKAWLFAVACLGAGSVAMAEPNGRWQVESARGQFAFYAEVLKSVRARVTPAARPDVDDRVNVAFRAQGALAIEAPGRIFRDLGEGALRLSSRGVLRGQYGEIRLNGLELRRGADPQTLLLVGPDGRTWFEADHMHFTEDRQAGRLRLYNLDVRLSVDAARILGDVRYTDLAVAVLELEAALPGLRGAVEQPLGQCTTPDWGQPHNDVAMVNISSVQQMASEGGRIAIAPSATLKNVGQTDVPWYSKFSGVFPPYNNDQHPFLVWNLYRVANGRIEQIGVSPLKHAFTTVNSNCPCSGGSILWVGCEDTYGTGTNDSSNSLGPRSEILAHVGYWQRCQSIFDVNCDGVPNSAPRTSTMDRRMAVLVTDLQTAGALYYIDSWYVVRDDVNIHNTMGWRRLTPNQGAQWTFTLNTPLALGPVIDQWVDPVSPGPNAQGVSIPTAFGDLRLAVRATDLGGGQWRYEYALMNFDFDSGIKSFSVPVPAGAVVTNASFRDPDNDPATDWPSSVAGGAITWQAPNLGASQPWSTLYNFGFTVNAAPTGASGTTATLGVKTARGWTLQPAVLGPGTLTVK